MYKFAWEKHNLHTLEKLFSLDIIYQEKPDNVFYGLEELKSYWIENSKKQKDVLFSVQKYVIFEDGITIDWQASFYHLIKRKNVILQGIMCWTLSNEKINTFREQFSIISEE